MLSSTTARPAEEIFEEFAKDVDKRYLILPSPKGTGILEQPKYGLSKAQSKRPY